MPCLRAYDTGSTPIGVYRQLIEWYKKGDIDFSKVHTVNLAECARYDSLISSLGGIDLQLLGIGHNGHIGFNEPDQAFGKMTHRIELNQRTIEANARFMDYKAGTGAEHADKERDCTCGDMEV